MPPADNKITVEVKLLTRFCKGCGLCVSVCEKKKLKLSSTTNERGITEVDCKSEVICSGCLKCTALCPEAAIEIVRVVKKEINRHEQITGKK